MQIFTHGSEDSLDHDVYVIFDHIPTFKEAKFFCHSLESKNPNILFLQDGIVQWCFKGTEDECNNSLFHTYHLHQQDYELPIKSLVQRDYELKLIRTVRGLLSYFSRTELRSTIKAALKNQSFEDKIQALRRCVLSYDIDYVKTDHVEVFKFFAFQLGQTLALLEDHTELFTKSSVAEHYPELRPYLYREESDVNDLQTFLCGFIDWIENHVEKTFDDRYLLICDGAKKEPFIFSEKSKF